MSAINEVLNGAASEIEHLQAFMACETFEQCPPFIQSLILDRAEWMRDNVREAEAQRYVLARRVISLHVRNYRQTWPSLARAAADVIGHSA
jgi:hypothetical protein